MRSIRQAAVRSDVLLEAVNATGSPGDLGPAELLDGTYTCEGPQVTVRDPRELLLDTLHQFAGDVETGIGTVQGLGRKAHSGIVADGGKDA